MARRILNFHPRIKVIRIQADRILEMLERFTIASLLLAQVAEQVLNLRFVRTFVRERLEYTFGHLLGMLAVEHTFTPKAMAFHPSKAIGHQFIRFLIMRFSRIVQAKLGHPQCQPGLNTIRVGKMSQRFFVHFHSPSNQASLVEAIGLF